MSCVSGASGDVNNISLGENFFALMGISCQPFPPALLIIRLTSQERSHHLALEKSSFHVKNAPLTPALPPQGAGGYCDAPIVSRLEMFDDCVQVLRHNRNRGMPQRRGYAFMPSGASEFFLMISLENGHDACGHRHTEWKF